MIMRPDIHLPHLEFLLPVECQDIVIDVLALNNFPIAED
jgi:hypothetical protein